MGTARKSASVDAFGFSNKVYLNDGISTSHYTVENRGKWSGLRSFSDEAGYYTGSGWSIDVGNGRDLVDAGGSSGQNTLFGGNGTDTLIGGIGSDRLDGGNGDDTLTGNAENDVFVLSNGDDVVTDFRLLGWMAQATRIIGFEDLVDGPGEYGDVASDYTDLVWSGAGTVTLPDVAGNSGANLVATGSVVGYNLDGGDLSFASANPNENFDFVSVDFAALTVNQRVHVRAYDDGREVGSFSFDARTDAKVHVDFDQGIVSAPEGVVSDDIFSGSFRNIDKIVIQSASGAPVAMDELTLRETVFRFEASDKIDVPDGFDIASYVASAVDDGDGNAVLTDGDNSLTLVGIQASIVSANWFI